MRPPSARPGAHLPRVRTSLHLALAALTGAACLAGGCDSGPGVLETQYASAAAAGPITTAAALRKAFLARTITANEAIDLAHERVEKVGDASSVAFARAVLEFIDQVEPEIEQAGVNELFWVRVGTLAGNSAAVAHKGQDLGSARRLVLGGPARWQNEAYWRQHPSHDALASLILHENGETAEALARLRERGELADDVAAAKARIEQDTRRRPRR